VSHAFHRSLSFGLSPRPVPDTSPMDPRVEEAAGQMLTAAQRHGKGPGRFTTDEVAPTA
jgi:hypothetical protein